MDKAVIREVLDKLISSIAKNNICEHCPYDYIDIDKPEKYCHISELCQYQSWDTDKIAEILAGDKDE